MVAGLARSNDLPLSSTTSDFSEYAHFSTVVDMGAGKETRRPSTLRRAQQRSEVPTTLQQRCKREVVARQPFALRTTATFQMGPASTASRTP